MKSHYEPFVPMQTVVPPGERGAAKISHFELENVELDNLRMAMTGFSIGRVAPGRYVRLHVDGELYMSDTPMEQHSNAEFVRRANGKVLVAGLGIGLIVKPLLARPEVHSITVVERSADVIELVAPHLASPKLTVIQADIFEWRPAKGTKYDTLYFDIWPEICEDNLPQIARLHNAFKGYRNRGNPDSFMDSWMSGYLRSERQRERRRYGYW